MNSDNLFIPQKIKVGYVKRTDTYTGKLAYVIYYDEKGKLRKELSWNSWRDEEIDSDEFENIPTCGFVLNKDIGGYKSHWNYRQSYIRIYDPRNFEFEITLENLLFILENTSSIKGKGLEGEFVYSWDGSDIVLLPTSSVNYADMCANSGILNNKRTIKPSELVIGCNYKFRDNSVYTYLGRFDKWRNTLINWDNNTYAAKNLGKHFWFGTGNYTFYQHKTVAGKIIDDLGLNEEYNMLLDNMKCYELYSPIDSSKNEYVRIDSEILQSLRCGGYNRFTYYNIVSGRYVYKTAFFAFSNNIDCIVQNYLYNPDAISVEDFLNSENYCLNIYLQNGRLKNDK